MKLKVKIPEQARTAYLFIGFPLLLFAVFTFRFFFKSIHLELKLFFFKRRASSMPHVGVGSRAAALGCIFFQKCKLLAFF